MKSTDEQHRTLHYVEVVYFEKGRYVERKSKYDMPDQCAKLFQRTVNKMTEEKKQCLIVIRDEKNQLLKSWKVF